MVRVTPVDVRAFPCFRASARCPGGGRGLCNFPSPKPSPAGGRWHGAAVTDEGHPRAETSFYRYSHTVRSLIRLLRRHLPPAGEGLFRAMGHRPYKFHRRPTDQREARRRRRRSPKPASLVQSQPSNASLTSKFRRAVDENTSVYPPDQRAEARKEKQARTSTGVIRTNQRSNASLITKFWRAVEEPAPTPNRAARRSAILDANTHVNRHHP